MVMKIRHVESQLIVLTGNYFSGKILDPKTKIFGRLH